MKLWFKILAVFIVLILLFVVWGLIDYKTSDCKTYEPDFNDYDNDGVVTPCPYGCGLGNCYGLQTACCPD